jgi:hypothetical protein
MANSTENVEEPPSSGLHSGCPRATRFQAGFEFSLDTLATNCYFGTMTMVKVRRFQLSKPRPACVRVPGQPWHKQATVELGTPNAPSDSPSPGGEGQGEVEPLLHTLDSALHLRPGCGCRAPLHSVSFTQFRENLFPRKKTFDGAREDLRPQMAQIHADNEFRVLLFPICVHLRHLRANPDSVAAGRAAPFDLFRGKSTQVPFHE